MRRYALPRLRDILFLSIFSAAILLGPSMLNTDGDLPRHLAIGKYVLQGNLPPSNDIFSYTRNGAAFAPHKWLSGVFFYLAYLIFDERGIVLLSACLLAATFTLIYLDGVKRTETRLPVFFLIIWGAVVSSLHWISRPHLFTMLLFAIWLILNERLASGRKVPIWYFAALMLLWNNLHGEFISGFLVTGATIAGWIWDFIFDRPNADVTIGKRLALVLVTITGVTLLNPVSFRAWSTITSWLGNDYLMSHTVETIPPNFADPKFLILLAFFAFSIFLLAIKQVRLPTRMAILLMGFSILVLLSARNVHFFGVVAPFVLITLFSTKQKIPFLIRYENILEKIESQLKGMVWPFLTILGGIILLATTPLGKIERFSPTFFPIEATQWLKTNPQDGNMFNPFDWGGYLSLELWPEKLVFIDSQGDVYGEAFIREYEQIISLGKGWQEILMKYNVSWALVPQEWDLASKLTEVGWRQVYRDQTAVILVREK
jgi:hypothetical protein